MEQLSITIVDDAIASPGMRHYRVACAHGVSTAALVTRPALPPDDAVLTALVAGHRHVRHCDCPPADHAAALLPHLATAA